MLYQVVSVSPHGPVFWRERETERAWMSWRQLREAAASNPTEFAPVLAEAEAMAADGDVTVRVFADTNGWMAEAHCSGSVAPSGPPAMPSHSSHRSFGRAARDAAIMVAHYRELGRRVFEVDEKWVQTSYGDVGE